MMEQNFNNKKMSQAMIFIFLFGMVSLFCDMTHESATSIQGAYLTLIGASAGAIGFISGLGELIGYSLRYVFGRITDKTHKYWLMVVLGYMIDVFSIPALALVGENGWIFACALIITQRMGKAIKKPAKNTLISFAASGIGTGKGFGIEEMLDQIGAFLGPVLLYVVMLFKTDGSTFEIYASCFAVLLIPAIITMLMLFLTKRKFPNPEFFEPETKKSVPFRSKKQFRMYIAGISLFAFGFIDYALVIMHVSKTGLIDAQTLPLLYAGAMAVDAIAALVFGNLYDKKGIKILVVSTLLSAPFAIFVFSTNSAVLIAFGVILWGIGMGAQESILKAVVTDLVPKSNRATGYGIFEGFFGVSWFLGSWLTGLLYEASLPAMIAISVGAQLISIPFFLRCNHKM